MTASKDGWFNVTQEVTISPITTSEYYFYNFSNLKTNFSFVERHTGNLVEDVNLIIFGKEAQSFCVSACPTPYEEIGYIPAYYRDITFDYWNELNLSTILENATTDEYTLWITAPGYFGLNTTYTPHGSMFENVSFNLEKIGALNLTILDSATNLTITETVYLTVESNTTQLNFTLTNGTGIIDGLNFDTNYSLFFTSASYEESYYNLFYNEQIYDFYYYMRQEGTNISIQIIDVLSNPIENVQVVVERFVNGTYVTIGSRLTDVQGLVIFNFVEGDTHKITVSKDGYISQTFTTQFPEGDLSVVLEESSQVDYTGATENVDTAFSPEPGTINGTTTFFWTVTPTDVSLDSFGITLYVNGSVIATNSSTTSSGGTLTITLNASAYNSSSILALYSYQKDGYSAVRTRIAYPVFSLYSIDAGVSEFRDWVASAFSITERIVLLAVGMLTLALILSFLLPATANVVVTGLGTLFLAYMLVLNLFVVGVIMTPIIFGGLVLASKIL